MKKRKTYTVYFCDYCGERAHQKCLICKKDICENHGIYVGENDGYICDLHINEDGLRILKHDI